MDILTSIRQPIEADFYAFEQAFEQTMGTSENSLLNTVLDYTLAKRGKKIRPMLVLLSSQLCHGVTDKSIQSAVALELLHTASLVHDDVVDASPLRRGANAVQEQWSNKIAILVGDWMFAKVIELIANIRNVAILNVVANMSKNLTSGELLQLHFGQTMWISEEQYMRVIENKTADLFAACCEIGGLSSGATQRQQTALRTFGRELGLIFQMKDDVLDYSDSEDLGKPTMNDVRDGKATLALLAALNRSSNEESAHIREIAEELADKNKPLDKRTQQDIEQEIKSFVIRYDGVRYCYQLMRQHRAKAVEALGAFHDNKVKQGLLDLVDFTINRIN